MRIWTQNLHIKSVPWTAGLRATCNRSLYDGCSAVTPNALDHAPPMLWRAGCVLPSGFTNRAQIQKARNFPGMIGQWLTQDASGWQRITDWVDGSPAPWLTGADSVYRWTLYSLKWLLDEIPGKHVSVTIWWYQGILLSSPTPLSNFLPLICHGFRNQLTKRVRTVLRIRVSILWGSRWTTLEEVLVLEDGDISVSSERRKSRWK